MLNLLALTKYSAEAASTRQRFLAYRPALAKAGIQLGLSPLFDDQHVRGLVSARRASLGSAAAAYARRMRAVLLDSARADLLWVHCELFPYLPSMFERLAFLRRKPVVFDYDDAIFHMYDDNALLRGKLGPLIAGASAVSAGNQYLADYAARFNTNVHVIPTVVDTAVYRPAASNNDIPVIGWIGSPSTWTFVRPYLPLLADLCGAGAARFLAVGAGYAAEGNRFPGMELRDWTEKCEIADIQSMDVGIMPLPDQPWARGKCGYKLIQYMACGLPVVASPVGVNATIVEDQVNGFLATSGDEWNTALRKLLGDRALRLRLGAAGRERIVADFSLGAWAPRLIELFRSVAPSA